MIFYFFFDSVLLSFLVLDIVHTEVRLDIHFFEGNSLMIEFVSDGNFVFQILSLIDRIENPFLDGEHEDLVSRFYQDSEFISSHSKCSVLQADGFLDNPS